MRPYTTVLRVGAASCARGERCCLRRAGRSHCRTRRLSTDLCSLQQNSWRVSGRWSVEGGQSSSTCLQETCPGVRSRRPATSVTLFPQAVSDNCCLTLDVVSIRKTSWITWHTEDRNLNTARLVVARNRDGGLSIGWRRNESFGPKHKSAVPSVLVAGLQSLRRVRDIRFFGWTPRRNVNARVRATFTLQLDQDR